MLQQAAELAQDSAMMAVVPMQSLFYTYPLRSNIPSLGRYAEDPRKGVRRFLYKGRTSLRPCVRQRHHQAPPSSGEGAAGGGGGASSCRTAAH